MPTRKEDLEKVIEQKVKPVINEAMHKFLGVTISEVSSDISDKIKKSPLLDFEIDISLRYKMAKRAFRRQYLIKMLETHYGNISLAAQVAGVDRRSIHRMIKSLGIHPEKMRKAMQKPYVVRQEAVSSIIEKSLDQYKTVIRPEKLQEVYKNVDEISKGILKELPFMPLTLKEAEEEFEKAYFIKALDAHANNISKTARAIGMRYETLHRKMKALGISLHKS